MPRNRIKMSAVCLRYSLLTNVSFRWLISFQLYTRNIRLNPSKDTSKFLTGLSKTRDKCTYLLDPFYIPGSPGLATIFKERELDALLSSRLIPTGRTILNFTFPPNGQTQVNSESRATQAKKNKCCDQSDTSLRNADQNPETRFALREVLRIHQIEPFSLELEQTQDFVTEKETTTTGIIQ